MDVLLIPPTHWIVRGRILLWGVGMKTHQPKFVEKPWGHELWIHNSPEYCGKLLVFPTAGNAFSMHYHMIKAESWYVQSGSFMFEYVDTEAATREHIILKVGECVDIPRGQPHQLIALEDNSIIFEISTEHFNEDSYRIWK